MGEVYRVTDTKLDRDVTIKIPPESFAGDKNRVARFKREAKVLATLNHPNIAAIYGIEKTDDTHALVMELVEGETLGERLKREPMIVEEALDCCKQIAEALTWSLKPDQSLPPPEPSPIHRLDVNLGIAGNLNLPNGTAARLSPDGSTLAYSSLDSGPSQIVVHSFPGVGGKKPISFADPGSRWPLCSVTNQELTFATYETLNFGG